MAGKNDKVKDKDRISTVQPNMKKCFFCGSSPTHIHEIFGGAFRAKSKEDGMCAGLCYIHHNGSNAGVHFNKELDLKLKIIGQKAWENNYIAENECSKDDAREAFISRYGKSYILDD